MMQFYFRAALLLACAGMALVVPAAAQSVVEPGRTAINGDAVDPNSNLYVRRIAPDDGGPDKANIYAFRSGVPSTLATGWGVDQSDVAIKGFCDWSRPYTAGVAGYTFNDYNNAGGVLGLLYDVGSSDQYYGALGFKMNDRNWAGYFNGDVRFRPETPAAATADPDVWMDVERSFSNDGFYDNHNLNVLFRSSTMPTGDRMRVYIGSTSSRCSGVFTESINALYLSSMGGVNPQSDNFYDLGSSALRWDDIYATNGTIQTSDRRSKTDIKKLEYGLEEVMKLKPVSFKWKNQQDDDTGRKLGLIAQDVQQVLPEVVKTHDFVENPITHERTLQENGLLGVYYSDIIPVLVGGMQEQQQIIDELSLENQDLKRQNGEILDRLEALEILIQSQQNVAPSGKTGQESRPEEDGTGASLMQNVPNPFHENTVIQYHVPEGAISAKLQITGINGKLVQSADISKPGYGNLVLRANSFAAGTYLYTLIVDGKVVDSKQMVLTD